MDIGPPPKLWTPSRPALIRAAEKPKSPAEARGIQASFPFPTFLPGRGFRLVGISEPAVNSPAIMPDGVAANDVAVFVENAVGLGSPPTQSKPADFATVSSYTGGSTTFRLTTSVKKLVGDEGGNPYSAQTGNSVSRLLIVLRAGVAYSSLGMLGQTGQITATTSNPPANTISVSASSPPLLLFGIFYNTLGARSGTLVDNAAEFYIGSAMGAFWEAQVGTPVNRTLDLGAPSAGATAISCFALRLVP